MDNARHWYGKRFIHTAVGTILWPLGAAATLL